MKDELLRVPVDQQTLERLRERAVAERRATSDEAAVILTRALSRPIRRRHTPDDPGR